MGSTEVKPGEVVTPTSHLLEEMKLLKPIQDQSGTRKAMSSELWYACAGPLVNLPHVGSLAYYFPQGHSEQVAVSTKRSATLQIPNYPNLPSQLLCQVHNVILHADKETDEIYAQMGLQPVTSEKDVFPIPDFRIRPNKHPSEFFCKTLTASDTSTHGGFSVPRRAAEKLFPPLDYTMQPPTQELVIRDLHDNTWTFRHIYRGQPKRHLLTTGWSLFVGSKRLKTGDSVLFIRDEKSQLMVGVRRANHQQTTLPSSVLSADSMQIGVFAAAAHAAANRSPFTIFYNPRVCLSEFVIPLAKFRKAVYGTQLSVGMRFGMVFETEESRKRRYMGTLVGISDLDPLRWPGSKWRNLQVEWDEPGCSDKHTRVSPWEIETPESLFIFPSLISGLQRPLPPGFLAGGDNGWENLINKQFSWIPQVGDRDILYSEQLMKPQVLNCPIIHPSLSQEMPGANRAPFVDARILQASSQMPRLGQAEVTSMEAQFLPHFPTGYSGCPNSSTTRTSTSWKLHPKNKVEDQKPTEITLQKSDLDQEISNANQASHDEKSLVVPANLKSPVKQQVQSQKPEHSRVPANLCQVQPLSESSLHPQPVHSSQMSDITTLNGSYPCLNNNPGEWVPQSSPYMSLSGIHRSPADSTLLGMQEIHAVFSEDISTALTPSPDIWDQQLNNLKSQSHARELIPMSQQNSCNVKAAGVKDWSDESNNQIGIYNSLNVDVNNVADPVVDPSVSSAVLDEYCTSKYIDPQNHPSDCLFGNFSSNQDVQSQITSISLADSQAFSQQDLPDSSGGTSCSNVDFDNSNLLPSSSWQQVTPRVRTFTKVQKAGSVGRSIDVSSFKNYEELCSAIECMFGLEGLLNHPRGSGWKLVYVDYENDVLLIGDDPWEEFVGCVCCIRILSPSEVHQMGEEGMKLLHNASLQGICTPVAECSNS